MKSILIIFSLVFLVFFIIKTFVLNGQSSLESYPYKVDKTFEDFEVRTYEASLFTSVKLSSGTYKEASGEGFSILAGYIFGGNKENEKIAMTSPVAMSLEDSMTMMFMVPKKYNKSTLPEPSNAQINFEEVEEKTVAAITFSAWADDQRIKKYKSKLIQALDREGISYTDKFFFLGYNPPYEVLNRRNEIIVELE